MALMNSDSQIGIFVAYLRLFGDVQITIYRQRTSIHIYIYIYIHIHKKEFRGGIIELGYHCHILG